MIPTINVNLKPCRPECLATRIMAPPHGHVPGCPGVPLPLPCPIPRSVTFEVVGGCDCFYRGYGHDGPPPSWNHVESCASNPTRVTCAIGGDGTWAGSEVTDIEIPSADEEPSAVLAAHVGSICRDRWALVKALVLGHTDISALLTGPNAAALLSQRDAVFSALAKMARAETAAMLAQKEVDEAFPYHRFRRVGDGDHRAPAPSVGRLAAYVEFLVEQIGVLS